jgi:outer membrane protein assembly factor BamB
MLNRRKFHWSAAAGIAVLARAHSGKSAESTDWMSWRGNNRDGSTDPSVWPTSLSGESLQLKWQHPLDSGYSGPIVSGGRVFVTETRAAKDEVVSALDLENGQVQWSVQWPGSLSVPFFAKENGDWIRSTPACDGTNLMVGGMKDVLVALDCQTGGEAWRIDFPGQFGSEVPSFGFVCSPLIDGDTVYVQAGGGMVAVDRLTGNVRWKTLDDGGGMWGSAFSSPVLATLHGVRQLLVQSRTHLNGIQPSDGRKLWEIKIEAFRGMNILTPTVWNDCVFTSSYGGRSLLFEFDPSPTALWSVRQRWVNKTEAYMSSPVIIDQNLYMHLRNRRLVCIDLETGKESWTTQPFGRYWSMVTNGRQILALDERGVLLLIQHNPAEFQLLDEREVSQEQSWAHLGISGENLLVRHLKGINVFRWKS